MSEVATIEAVAKAVHDLADSVSLMKAGIVSRETVEAIVRDLVEKQEEAARVHNAARGYTPQDETSERLADRFKSLTPDRRFELMHSRPAAWVAARTGRPVEDIQAMQQAADTLLFTATAFEKDPRELKFYQEEYLPLIGAAVDTQTAAEGLEFIPRELSGDLIERINLELMVLALFPSIPMPTNPFDITARGVNRVRGGKHAEQTADTGQTKFKVLTPGTRKVSLAAAKFVGEILTSKEMEEDSIVAVIPFLTEELVDFLSADLEDACINGNIAGTQDNDSAAADDPRRNWDGLRTLTQAGRKTDAANAALTVAMIRTNRKVMGKYGIKPGDLAHIVSMNNYIQLLSDTNVITMDKYGTNATILSGELGKVDGSPIIVSEFVRTNLNATGVFDNVTTNRSVALTVNRRGWLVGERRGMTLQLLKEIYAESDQDAILASTRKALSPRFPVATEGIVAAHINLLT